MLRLHTFRFDVLFWGNCPFRNLIGERVVVDAAKFFLGHDQFME